MSMQRAVASAGFVLLLLTLALPWMTLSVGCTGGLAPKTGIDLLHANDAQISVHHDNDQAEGTVHIDPQPAIWAVLILAVAGAAAYLIRNRRGFFVRAAISAAALAVVAVYSGTLVNGSPGVTFHGTGTPPETQVRAGEWVATIALLPTLLLNLTLPLVFPEERARTWDARTVVRLGVYVVAVALASGLGLWGIALAIGAAT